MIYSCISDFDNILKFNFDLRHVLVHKADMYGLLHREEGLGDPYGLIYTSKYRVCAA